MQSNSIVSTSAEAVEVQHKLERLQCKIGRISRSIGHYEAEYRRYGLTYHSVPLVVRNDWNERTDSVSARAFTRRSGGGNPPIIDDLFRLREKRDLAKRQLRSVANLDIEHDPDRMEVELETAAENLVQATTIRVELREELDAIEDDLYHLQHQRLAVELRGGSIVICVPNQRENPEAFGMMRDWILLTPAARTSIELGESEDTAVFLFVQDERDGPVYNEMVEELGPSDDEEEGQTGSDSDDEGPGYGELIMDLNRHESVEVRRRSRSA